MTRDYVDEDHAVQEIIERLETEFPAATPDAVRDVVGEARSSYTRAKIRDFVPVLIEREARARLRRPLV